MDPSRARRHPWIWWGLVAVYVALIFALSSRPHLRAPVSFPLWDKLAHLGEYGILGFLGQRAAAASWPARGGRAYLRGALVIACGLVIALADEMLQAQVPGRQASLADFVFDGLGLSLAFVANLSLQRLGMRSRGVS
ncbi:MAG: hypothetical protein GF330_09825 [Candidatus Eisenbacteria bacterium]|nr:hypothetical protein [Candidatus Eisenbacteria bacterium]